MTTQADRPESLARVLLAISFLVVVVAIVWAHTSTSTRIAVTVAAVVAIGFAAWWRNHAGPPQSLYRSDEAAPTTSGQP